MPLFGVDVSSHKGMVDWAKVAAAGFTFAINRACLDTKPDSTWKRNDTESRKHGLIPGAYHFLYPSTSVPATQQCDAFLSVIGDPTGLLIALDVESDSGGAYQPRFSDVTAWVDRFRAKHPDHPLFIYSGGWYWNSSTHPIHNANGSGLGMLWDSHYVTTKSPTTAAHLYAGVASSWWGPRYGGWKRVTLLQFSSSGVVPGVSGNCDVNAFAGTLAELHALTGSTTPPDTSTGADMADFTLLSGPAGSVSLKGDSHSYLRLVDNSLHPISAATFGTKRGYPIKLAKPIPGGTGDRATGYLIGVQAAFVLAVDVTFTPDAAAADTSPFTQTDVDRLILADRAKAHIVY